MDFYKIPSQKLAGQVREDPALLDEIFAMLSHFHNEVEDLNIFILFDPENIQKEMTFLKEKIAKGKSLSLAGVPVSLEDNICTENIATTCGSKMLSTYKPPFNSWASEKLQEAGAILAGKTNLEEFGVGCRGNSSFYGAAKNPWDQQRIAGKGAAAAVSTLMLPLSIATDTIGELRQAASYCGVIGFRPTYGRVSRRGVIEYASSMAQLGIISRKTSDLAAALEIISGPDPQDPTSMKGEVPSYRASLQNEEKVFKIAVPDNWDQAPGMEKDVKECFLEQLHNLTAGRVQVEYIPLRYFHKAYLAAAVISAAEAFSNLANYDGVRFGYRGEGKSLQDMYIKSRSEGFSSKLKQFLTFGALVSSGKHYEDYFLKSQRMRTRIKNELADCLERYDLLLTPTTPFTAPLAKPDTEPDQLADPALFYTAAASLAGLPALTFPLYTSVKRPAGLQFMGKAGDEASLLQISALLEERGISLSFPNPGSIK